LKILFVARADSIHAVRWINQLHGQGWDIHLFSAMEKGIHPQLREVTVHYPFYPRSSGANLKVEIVGQWPSFRGMGVVKQIVGQIRPSLIDRSSRLASTIEKLRPDVIHSLQIQHSGYLTLEAKRKVRGRFPIWAVSNWGSDIHYSGRLPDHAPRIRGVLAECDYYHCECERDVDLAREFGFRGVALPVIPAGGGFDLDNLQRLRQPGPASSRRAIAFKGRQGWAGRSMVGLRAIETCADILQGYTVVLYSAEKAVQEAADEVARRTGISFEIERTPWPREAILRMHGRARVSIALSITDGINTSFLEALVMGSFPIQSNTNCGSEWISCGESGFLVEPEDQAGVANAIRRAIADDALIDRAFAINSRTIADRAAEAVVRPKAVGMYNKMVAEAVKAPAR
jgi:glycosyltransferase involved in cell wall biosynthesis